jgi:hypothetical protein
VNTDIHRKGPGSDIVVGVDGTSTALGYALLGHCADDVASHRAQARWYTTKTEPSYDDMAVKLRRVIIAAGFRGHPLSRPPRRKPRAVLAAWTAAGT